MKRNDGDAEFVRAVLDEVRDGCHLVLMVTPKMRRAIEAALSDEELDLVTFKESVRGPLVP